MSEIWAINFVQNSNYSVTDSEQSSTDSKVKQQDSHADLEMIENVAYGSQLATS